MRHALYPLKLIPREKDRRDHEERSQQAHEVGKEIYGIGPSNLAGRGQRSIRLLLNRQIPLRLLLIGLLSRRDRK